MPREYVIAWAVYALAALGALLAGWVISARWPAFIRGPVRGLALACLTTPVVTELGESHFAPAFIVLLFEGLLKSDGDPVPAATALLLATLAAWVVLAIVAGVRRLASPGR